MATEKWLIESEKIIDIDMVRKLKVGLIGGKVDIVGHDEPGARVEVHSVSKKPLKVSINRDTLEVDHPQLSWDNFIDVFKSFNNNARADVSIMVPRDVALKFGTVSRIRPRQRAYRRREDQHRERGCRGGQHVRRP